LIALGQGLAVTVLQKLGIDLEMVRMEVEKQVGTGPDEKLFGNIPYTPRVKKVLALASKEARSLNHTYVGTEHILLGILREGEGVAGLVLKNLEVDIEQTRLHILRELDPNSAFDRQMQSASSKDTAPLSPGSGKAPTAPTAKPTLALIDVEKRYDVYCSELNPDIVVYSNVLFKGLRRLFRENHDSESDFIELEQADGQTIFVVKYSIIKFCAPGATPGAEKVSGLDC
jgi:ATP-dependent Clp protease ATP-binding subunit ClpA